MNIVYNVDCMEAMRRMPDKCFDLAVCDPPYGIGAVNMRRGNSVIKADNGKHWDDTAPAQGFSSITRQTRPESTQRKNPLRSIHGFIGALQNRETPFSIRILEAVQAGSPPMMLGWTLLALRLTRNTLKSRKRDFQRIRRNAVCLYD